MAFLALVVQILLAGFRWLLLTDRLGLPGGPRGAFLIYLVGGIAGLVLVTSVAAASLRLVMHCRLGASIATVAFSILAEKALAIVALGLTFLVLALIPQNQMFLLSTVMDLAGDMEFMPTWRLVFYGMGAFGLVAVGCFVGRLLFVRLQRSRDWLRVQKDAVREMGRRLAQLRRLLPLLVISVVIYLLGGGAILLTAKAFLQPLSASIFLLLYPAIAIISALPISLGGWGVRESAMVVALSLMSVAPEHALAISIVYALAGMAATGLLGGIAYALLLLDWDKYFGASKKSSSTGPSP